MRRVEIAWSPNPSERAELVAFVERMTVLQGARPLSDHLWLELNRQDPVDGFVVVSAADPSGVLALAQISATNEGSTLEVVSDTRLGDAQRIHDDVLETAVDAFRRVGGGRLTWWVDADDPATSALAARVGLELSRSLHEMRTPLPLAERASVATRAFTPSDAEAWLRVNNLAFADHPEQGGWTLDTLALRTAEAWFDPDGFRLYEHDDEVAAFCWTKVHRETEPPLGEIYVIGVDPALHGRGLGRQLTLAGLDWLSDHGIETATLYVDGGNTAALHLYERLGFVKHRSRFAFAGTLSG